LITKIRKVGVHINTTHPKILP